MLECLAIIWYCTRKTIAKTGFVENTKMEDNKGLTDKLRRLFKLIKSWINYVINYNERVLNLILEKVATKK